MRIDLSEIGGLFEEKEDTLECPKADHTNCQEISNSRVYAIIREDQSCLMEAAKEKKEIDAINTLKEKL